MHRIPYDKPGLLNDKQTWEFRPHYNKGGKKQVKYSLQLTKSSQPAQRNWVKDEASVASKAANEPTVQYASFSNSRFLGGLATGLVLLMLLIQKRNTLTL